MGVKDVIKLANRLYYDEGVSDLSDDEFDAIEDYARSSGIDVTTFTPPPAGTDWPIVDHFVESDKIHNVIRDVDEFSSAIKSGRISMDGFMSPKHDGLACELIYDDRGILKHAILRGDGTRGEDVVSNVAKIGNVPSSVKAPNLVVWVEITISENNLKVLNEVRSDFELAPYKTARNAVAIVRSKKAHSAMLNLFTAIAIMPYHSEVEDKFQESKLDWLKTVTPNNIPFRKFVVLQVLKGTAIGAWKWRNKLESIRDRWQYLLDGVVWRDLEGKLTKIKFEPSAAVTVVEEIVEQLGRTGVVSFVVKFKSVRLSGADVQRATGHNASLIASRLKGIGIGAKILVSRRGDVIPHIERVIEEVPEEDWWIPSMKCPSCGSNADWDGAYIKCSADPSDCPGTTIGLLRKFVMAHGIKGLGISRLTVLSQLGVATPGDLYVMTPEWLSTVVVGGHEIGFSEAEKIYRSIARKSEMSWGELLGSIGVPGCAESIMKEIARVFTTPEDLALADVNDFIKIDGIGRKRAENISAFLDLRWSDTIQPLLDVVSIRNMSGPLSGMVFCITLALSKPRQVVESIIRQNGGDVKSGVSSRVTHLICNTPDEKTSKLTKARELKIPILHERELYEMIGSGQSSQIDTTPIPENLDF